MIELYGYQADAVKKIHRALERTKRALVVMASGLGKTIVGVSAVKRYQSHGTGLFLCHNNDILEQAMAVFREILGDQAILGIYNGYEKHVGKADILFASFQTMRGNMQAFRPDQFHFVIVDESHHSQARTFKSVIEYFRPELLLALTATPDRMDRKDIREIFGREVVEITIEEGIANGWLTPVEYHLVTDKLDHWKFKKVMRDVLDEGRRISMKQLNETIFIEARDRKVVEIIESYGDRKAIVFCECISHTENFASYLPRSLVLHSRLGQARNQKVLSSFKNGDCRQIRVIDKMNEGVDVPDADLIVFLRSTDSRTVFLQQLGRGLRRTQKKEKVIVLDFVSNVDRVRMVYEMSERIKRFARDSADRAGSGQIFVREPFHFVFTDEQIDLIKVLKRLAPRYVSEIPWLNEEYSARNAKPASEVLAGTHAKLWWICKDQKCRHEWQANGNNRMNGSGCPACANQVVTKRNNLKVTHPHLAREYMSPPKNVYPADQVIAGTAKPLWWKCKACGFEYLASGNSRIYNNKARGSGCPACAHRTVTAENNLAATHPDLSRQFSVRNRLRPLAITAGTGMKLWWKCDNRDCGHEWQAKGSDRVNGSGCPLCSHKKRSESLKRRFELSNR